MRRERRKYRKKRRGDMKEGESKKKEMREDIMKLRNIKEE